MIANLDVLRYPALIIGLGGSGVRTLRFIKWLAARGDDPGLRKLLDRGALQLLGIDTDEGANKAVDVDEYVLPRPKGWRADKKTEQRRLPQLDAVFHVLTDDIVRAFENARRASRRPNHALSADDHGESSPSGVSKLPAVPNAIFQLPRGELEEMTLGQAREGGAGQWRLLGRIGLFTRCGDIYARLQEAYKHVRDATPQHKKVRAYVVCSLGGGTGSGMFWDVAHLLRLIDANCIITGSFLLADAFRGADTVGRLEPNVYAALKEITVYKNWRLSSGMRTVIDYPIGEKGVRFEAEPGSESAFNTVYIYQGFATVGEGGGGEGIHASKLQLTALRMAENIAAQLRDDLHTALEGAENAKSDTATRKSQDERGYVFSTSAYVPLAIAGIDALIDTFRASFIKRISYYSFDNYKPLGLADLLSWLQKGQEIAAALSPLPSEKRLSFVSHSADKPDKAPDIVTLWREHIKDRSPNDPKFIVSQLNELQTLKNEAAKLTDKSWRGRHEERAKKARDLYETHVNEKLRKEWRAILIGEDEDWRTGDLSASLNILDLYEEDLKALWLPVRNAFKALREDMKSSLTFLDADAKIWFEKALSELEDLKHKYDLKKLQSFIPIRAPASLIQMRATLDILKAGRDDNLERWRREYGDGPLDLILIAFTNTLATELKNVKDRISASGEWKDIIAFYLAKESENIYTDIQSILNIHDENQNKRLTCVKEISRFANSYIPESYRNYGQAAEDFEVLMEPLERVLDGLFHPHDDDPLRAAIEGLMDAVADAARHRSNLEQDAFEKSESLSRKWRDALNQIHTLVKERKKKSQNSREKEPIVEELAKTLEDNFLVNGKYYDIINLKEKRKEYFLHSEIYAAAFVRFWCEQSIFVLARLGGEEGVARTIEKCRSKVFGGGAVKQTIQRSHLVIGLPRMSDLSHTARQGGLASDIKRQLALAAQQVLHIPPVFTKSRTDNPYVYYQEMYRAGAEILEVAQYRRSYMAFEERLRALFHIDPEAAHFPDLIDDDGPAGTVLCGNPKCKHNIANLDRHALICPGCGEPIRNRCGNRDCSADDLAEQIPFASLDASGRPSPSRCPKCRGELRTYWWRCPEPQHAQRWISTHEKECPQCRREYMEGSRSYKNIRLVDPQVSTECPGCVNMKLPHNKRARIPADLRQFFHEGVSSAAQATFNKLVDRHDLDPHYCINSDQGEHMMFPGVDFVFDGQSRRLLAHREGAAFVGEMGEPVMEHTCFHCGYPIDSQLVEGMRAGRPLNCPRCMRALKECAYCSHHDAVLFSPVGNGGVERCPRCTNRISREVEIFSRVAADGVKRAGFCRNLFGCRAGSRPWGSAADFAHDRCSACHNLGESETSLLLRYEDLAGHIDRCPICLSLLGLPKGSRVEKMSPGQLLQHFLHREPSELQTPCVICGVHPAAALKWMAEADYFSGASIEHVPERDITALTNSLAGSYALPAISAKDGMDILEALLNTETEDDLFQTVMELPVFRDRQISLPATAQELQRLFVGRSISPRVIKRRLDGLEKNYEEVMNREIAPFFEPAF